MFEPLLIRSVFREYSVEFSADFLGRLKNLHHDGDFVIADARILELYPEIRSVANGALWCVESHEESKSYEGLVPLFERLINGGFRKNNRLLALGGGITQDIASFVASLLYRGVDWYFFPTNMLTQCDSCIGSKTSINFRQFKNQLGGFYPPAGVIIDTGFARSLGEKEICSGLGEMLHYFLLSSESDLDLFWKHAPSVKAGKGPLEVLMLRSLTIKKAMIEIDEFDRGPRNIFNYGHSFGHALESASDYAVPHGIAVAYGIDLANLVSVHLGLLPVSERNRLRPACELVFGGFPLGQLDLDRYLDALGKDKKNVGSQLGLILTRGVGEMFKRSCELDGELRTLIRAFFEDKLYMAAQ